MVSPLSAPYLWLLVPGDRVNGPSLHGSIAMTVIGNLKRLFTRYQVFLTQDFAKYSASAVMAPRAGEPLRYRSRPKHCEGQGWNAAVAMAYSLTSIGVVVSHLYIQV